MEQKEKSSGSAKKYIIAFVVVIIIALGLTGLFYYLKYFGPNVTDKQEYLFIHTGASY